MHLGMVMVTSPLVEVKGVRPPGYRELLGVKLKAKTIFVLVEHVCIM